MPTKKPRLLKVAIGLAVAALASLAFAFRPTLPTDLTVTFKTDQTITYWVGDRAKIVAKVEVHKLWSNPRLYLQLTRVHFDAQGQDLSYESAADLDGYGPMLNLTKTHPLRAGENVFSLAIFPAGGVSAIKEDDRLKIYAYQATLPNGCPSGSAETRTAKLLDCGSALSYELATKNDWYLAKQGHALTKLGIGETEAFTFVSKPGSKFGGAPVTVINFHGVVINSVATSKAQLQDELNAIVVK